MERCPPLQSLYRAVGGPRRCCRLKRAMRLLSIAEPANSLREPMNDQPGPADNQRPRLLRRFGLLQATALNMSNMIGIGPFITIPLLMSALNGGGPQAMLGWIVAVIIAMADGLVWSELGAARPGSGGT